MTLQASKQALVAGNTLTYKVNGKTQAAVLSTVKTTVLNMVGSGKYKTFKISDVEVNTRKTNRATVRSAGYSATLMFTK